MSDSEKAERLLYKYYDEDNYEIIDINCANRSNIKKCYIFFSSNGLYKDRNNIQIVEEMHETNRYEWKFISSNKKIIHNASRIIFLRDIFKIFYIRGISSQNNTVDKIADLLIELTKGMDVILAGSSAGAYMSLLVGSMLPNTKRIISLGGIADLESFRHFSSYMDDNLDSSNYFNISNRLYGDYWIINFYGKKNNYDGHNGELIEEYSNTDKLINVGFDLDAHAPRPSGDDLVQLLTCNDNHLLRLHKKLKNKNNVSEVCFSTYNIGYIKTYYAKLKALILKAIKKK